MASRNSTRSSTSRSSSDAQSSTDPRAGGEAVRQQFGLMTQGAENLLRAAEIWQQAQLQLTQRARTSWRDAAARMQQVANPAELVPIQAGLVLSAMQQAMQFSVDLMTGVVSQPGAEGADAQQASTGSASAANVGLAAVAPMVQAWQSMFTPADGAGGPTTH